MRAIRRARGRIKALMRPVIIGLMLP